MSLHSGYELTQFLDLVADDVPEFSLPSYLETFEFPDAPVQPFVDSRMMGADVSLPSGHVRELWELIANSACWHSGTGWRRITSASGYRPLNIRIQFVPMCWVAQGQMGRGLTPADQTELHQLLVDSLAPFLPLGSRCCGNAWALVNNRAPY